MTFESIIVTYGYPAIFLGAILEGETVLLLAAVLAQKGFLDYSGVVLAAGLGAFTGDQFFYRFGRLHGRILLANHPGWGRRIKRASALLERYPQAVLLGYRFLYGLRAVIPYMLGAGTCRPRLFTVLSGIGAVVWSVVITTGGYFGGRFFSNALQAGMSAQKWLFVTGCGVVVLVLIGRIFGRRNPGR